VIPMKQKITLDGVWKFCPAFPELEANQRFMDPSFDPSSPGELEARKDIGWIKPDFDDAGWIDYPVPNTWNKAVPELWSYEGYGWYRRAVDIPSDWENMRVEFHCESANYRTVVYVNGVEAGSHDGGYTPFSIPIHEFLRFGERNSLAISVDNIPKPERCPGGEYGWWNYGGIYRSTSLVVSDRVRLEDVRIVTKPGKVTWEVEITATVADDGNGEGRFVLQASLEDPDGSEVAGCHNEVETSRGSGTARAVLEVPEARLWSPEEPNLYELTLNLGDPGSKDPRDTWKAQIGIRSIEVVGPRLLINGKPLMVKGLNRHPEYPATGHREREEDLVKDLELVKDLGANTLRCHYPYSPRTFELCDRMGIFLCCEVPLYQWGRPAVKADSPETLDAAKLQLAEMIRNYRNHPCVLMWSVSNENMTKPRVDDERHRLLTEMTVAGNLELVDMAHQMDPTRPVVEVSNCWPGDPVFERTDICAVNIYIGAKTPHVDTLHTLTDRMRERFDELRKEYPDRPILAGEFGSWAIRGLKTDYFPGEEYQARLIENYWKGLVREPNFVGGFIWCFQDSDVHRRFEWDYEFRIAYGLYDLERRPKESVDAVRRMWAED
jgi:beta-glucuronidase